jgi:hypothetical protein
VGVAVTVLEGGTDITVTDVLRRAADILEEWEWSRTAAVPTRRKIRDGIRSEKLCMIGAVIQARADLGLTFTYMPVDELEALGFAPTWTGFLQWERACWWNQRRTHKDEVVARLRPGAHESTSGLRAFLDSEQPEWIIRALSSEPFMAALLKRNRAGTSGHPPPAA